MAQRWMQAKLLLARTHGLTVSGAGRATGDVWDDRKVQRMDETVKGEITRRAMERDGQRIVEVTPVLRKVKGTVVIFKSRDKMPRRLQAKLDAVKTNYIA